MNPDKFPNAATLMDWSRILKVSYATICKYQKLGVLKGKRQVDRSIIVPKTEIMKWLGIGG
jgi:predicted site-specific integrase-resolvase